MSLLHHSVTDMCVALHLCWAFTLHNVIYVSAHLATRCVPFRGAQSVFMAQRNSFGHSAQRPTNRGSSPPTPLLPWDLCTISLN